MVAQDALPGGCVDAVGPFHHSRCRGRGPLLHVARRQRKPPDRNLHHHKDDQKEIAADTLDAKSPLLVFHSPISRNVLIRKIAVQQRYSRAVVEYAHEESHAEDRANNEDHRASGHAQRSIGGDETRDEKTHDRDVPGYARMMKTPVIREEAFHFFLWCCAVHRSSAPAALTHAPETGSARWRLRRKRHARPDAGIHGAGGLKHVCPAR